MGVIFSLHLRDTIPYSMEGKQECQVLGNDAFTIKRQRKINNSFQLTLSQFMSPAHEKVLQMFRVGLISSVNLSGNTIIEKPRVCFHSDCKFRKDDN